MLEGEAFNLVYCFPNAISMSLCIVMLEAVVEAEASETITELLMLHNVKNAKKKVQIKGSGNHSNIFFVLLHYFFTSLAPTVFVDCGEGCGRRRVYFCLSCKFSLGMC